MTRVEISGPGEDVIERMLASGHCKDAKQAVELSLRLLDEHLGHKRQKLRRDLADAMTDVHEGRVAPLDMAAIKREARVRHEQESPSA